jgi:hypothetical protein
VGVCLSLIIDEETFFKNERSTDKVRNFYLGEKLLGTFLELLGVIGEFCLYFTKEVSEEEIEKNIELLKECDWFQGYLKNNTYNNLITGNTRVRYEIGKCNIEKMKNEKYVALYQKRIRKVLLKESKKY